MSILFTPKNIGTLEIENRFVHSATYEGMADKTGEVSENLVERYRTLAKGGVGLIIPGVLFVHHYGRGFIHQAGIHNDEMIPGLASLAQAIHEHGKKVVFQIGHTGRQTSRKLIGRTPMSPSKGKKDPVYRVSPAEMTENEIRGAIEAFAAAAVRAEKAGADGVQLHCAHGYLISQFLSPFFNHRQDDWGGNPEKCFRFLKEAIIGIRQSVSADMPIIIKMNGDDYTPEPGVTPELAKQYASWLAECGVQGIEVSCGTASFSLFYHILGEVPVKEILDNVPWPFKIFVKLDLKKHKGKYNLTEGYNLHLASQINPDVPDVALITVGGHRTVAHMEAVIRDKKADFISLCRPFIREPNLVKKIKEKSIHKVSCISCNKCIAAVPLNLPIRCYRNGLPGKRKGF